MKVQNRKHGGIDLSFNMQDDLSMRFRYKIVMYTNEGKHFLDISESC